jgi:GT2 family glycosyltransferase
MKRSDLVQIVVRCKDNPRLTRECVVSLEKTQHPYELILVDDGSEERQPAEDFADIVVRSTESSGAVTATNYGLMISLQRPGDYVMVMDNDTLVPQGDPHWLRRMVDVMEKHPDVGAVPATSSNCYGQQQVLRVPDTYTADWEDGERSGVADPPAVPMMVSFCVLLRKSAVLECGSWDTRYNPGNFEDTDYAIRLRESGWTVRVAESVYIHHRCHQTFGDKMDELMQKNQQKLIEKWGFGRLVDLGIYRTGGAA